MDVVWILGSKLGEGVSSNVYKTLNVKDGKKYAVKISKEEKFIKNLKREADLLKTIKNPYVITYVDSFYCDVKDIEIDGEMKKTFVPVEEISKTFALILELCTDSVGEYFAPKNIVSLADIRKTFKKIGLGCAYLNDNGIIHGDIKLENMIFCNGDSKITDLGLFKHVDREYTTYSGTPYYTAPEIWTDKHYSILTDSWAFGVAIYRVYFSKFPFNAVRKNDPRYASLTPEELKFAGVPRSVISDSLTFPFTPPTELKNLLESLMTKDPAERITIKDALNTPFFNI